MTRRIMTSLLTGVLAISAVACEKAGDDPDVPTQNEPSGAAPAAVAESTAAVPAAPELDKAEAAEKIFTSDGYGPLKIGATLADVTAAFATKLTYSSEVDYSKLAKGAAATPTGKGCETLSSSAQFPGVSMMFEDGVLTRIDAFGKLRKEQAAGVPTLLQIGNQEISVFAETKASLIAKTGDLFEITPHKYSETGSYLENLPDGEKNGVVIETEGDVINSLRVGKQASVQYVEGCL